MNFLKVAILLQELLAGNKDIINSTSVIQSGERVPKAQFRVITSSGEILEVTVKRQAAGLEGTVAKSGK